MNIKRIIGYIGSKVNLYDFLDETIIKNNPDKKLFIDLFAGTCAVSKFVKEKTDMDIMTNDLALYSKILTSELKINELSEKDFRLFKNTVKELDSLPLIEGDFYHEFSMGGAPKTITDKSVFEVKKREKDAEGNVISETSENNQEYKTSRMYFKGEVGKKIDTIREGLGKLYSEGKINEEIKDLALLFLLSYANGNSNNTSVYGAYLKHDKMKTVKPFYNEELLEYLSEKYEAHKKSTRKIKSFHDYADKTLSNIRNNHLEHDSHEIVVYWDPPYSSRSYESNYHILEYLCDMDFSTDMIKHNSKTGMKNSEIKYDNPFASKVRTPAIFKELISESMKISDLMYISYNDEGLMKRPDIEKILKEVGEEHGRELSLKEHLEEYKRFTSGEAGGANNDKKNTVNEIIWEIRKK